MQIVTGKIALEKTKKKNSSHDISFAKAIWAPECHLCMKAIHNAEQSRMGCLNNLCKLTCHIICLANHMLASDLSQSGHYVPISGECPLCETPLLWIDLLQRKRKMQGIAEEEDDEDSDNESSGSDSEMNHEEGNESFSDC